MKVSGAGPQAAAARFAARPGVRAWRGTLSGGSSWRRRHREGGPWSRRRKEAAEGGGQASLCSVMGGEAAAAVTARFSPRPVAYPAASLSAPLGARPGPAAARGRERAGSGLFLPSPPASTPERRAGVRGVPGGPGRGGRRRGAACRRVSCRGGSGRAQRPRRPG